MPNSCSAIGCTNRHRTGENIRFYGFPLKKKELLTLWLRALKRKNFKPTKYSKVCSDHFVEDDYLPRPGTYIKRLKPDAVPSIFSQFPSYYQKKKVERKNIQHSKRTNSNEVASTSSQFQIAEHSLDVIPNETQVLPSTVTREIQTNLSGSELDETTNSLKHKVKVLQQKLRRRNKKITNIVDLLKTLRKRNLIEQQVETLLQNKFEGMAQELFKNELHNTESTNMGRRYSREMKEFALTLHFHSPKAYNFCRTILKLPHPSAITRWTCSVNAEPGFFKDVFAVLSTFPLEDRDCNLILDGMSIRKQQLWNNAKGCFEGYCDFGNNFQIEDSDALATEALVFMLVSLNGKWKLPIGFVLQNKSTAIIQAQLIKTALTLSYESGLRVLGVTCDGAPTNFSSLDMLGCKIKGHFKYFQTSFKLDNHENDICFIPDACHMLKLARNTLAEYQQFQSSDGVIMWQYIVKLYELQNELGFKFANKLGKSHVEWEHNKMKVKLAAQVISSSVADALEFLKNRDIEIFRDCKETIQFIRVVDKLFDFLNSRNPYGKGFKKPIYPDNLQYLESEIMPLIEYLFTLKDMNGSFLHMGKKKRLL